MLYIYTFTAACSIREPKRTRTTRTVKDERGRKRESNQRNDVVQLKGSLSWWVGGGGVLGVARPPVNDERRVFDGAAEVQYIYFQ